MGDAFSVPFILEKYNTYIENSNHRKSIAKGWKKAGISEVINGSKELSPEDPFVNLQ